MDVDIPLYSAAFVSPEELVVVGGGGKGKHGLANKVVLLRARNGALSKTSEHLFSPESDCPMAVAVENGRIIVGVNGHESNLEVFAGAGAGETRALIPTHTAAIFPPGAYTRVLAASPTHTAAVGAANSGASPLVVLDAERRVLWETDPRTDLRDVSLGGGLVAALEPKRVHFFEAATGARVHTLEAPAGARFSRGQFASPTKFVAAVAAKKRVELQVYKIEEAPMLVYSTRVALPSVSALGTNGEIIAVGSASGEVQVFNSRLSVLQRPKALHKLPVSGVAVSSAGEVASVSVAGTLHLLSSFGERSLFGGLAVAGWTFASAAILVVLVALVYSRIQTLAAGATLATQPAPANEQWATATPANPEQSAPATHATHANPDQSTPANEQWATIETVPNPEQSTHAHD